MLGRLQRVRIWVRRQRCQLLHRCEQIRAKIHERTRLGKWSHTAQIYPIDTLVENIGLSVGYTSYDPRFNYLPATGAVPLPASAAAESVGPDDVDYPNYPFYMIFDSTRMKAGALSSGGWPGLVSLLHPAGTQQRHMEQR